jgi:hypothetical protein
VVFFFGPVVPISLASRREEYRQKNTIAMTTHLSLKGNKTDLHSFREKEKIRRFDRGTQTDNVREQVCHN